MDSNGIENLRTRLSLPELVIKQVAEQVVNEQLLYNFNFYLIITLILFLTTSASNFLTSYLRKRGENFATKTDFENILNQIKAQTKTTEEVKAAINHKDWVSKEWKTLRRIKLEELMITIYEIYPWHKKKIDNIISYNLINEAQILDPLKKIRAIALLYFPELSEEYDVFERCINNFDIWTKQTIINIPEPKDRLKYIDENGSKYFIDIIKAINSIEEKSRQIMQNIICTETDQI